MHYAILEDHPDVFDVLDLLRRVTFYHHQVGVFSGDDSTDAIQLAQVLRAVMRRDLNRLQGSEPGFDEEFQFALIIKSGKYSSDSRGMGSSKKQASALHKGTLKLHFFL